MNWRSGERSSRPRNTGLVMCFNKRYLTVAARIGLVIPQSEPRPSGSGPDKYPRSIQMSLKWMLPTLLMTSLVSHAQTPVALKDVFKGYFHVGGAINQAQFEERDARGAAIVREQFDTISPENVLKWESVHPRPDLYAFDAPDRDVAFGQKHHMFIIGHTLGWNNT